jgi:hypothetical protein
LIFTTYQNCLVRISARFILLLFVCAMYKIMYDNICAWVSVYLSINTQYIISMMFYIQNGSRDIVGVIIGYNNRPTYFWWGLQLKGIDQQTEPVDYDCFFLHSFKNNYFQCLVITNKLNIIYERLEAKMPWRSQIRFDMGLLHFCSAHISLVAISTLQSKSLKMAFVVLTKFFMCASDNFTSSHPQ